MYAANLRNSCWLVSVGKDVLAEFQKYHGVYLIPTLLALCNAIFVKVAVGKISASLGGACAFHVWHAASFASRSSNSFSFPTKFHQQGPDLYLSRAAHENALFLLSRSKKRLYSSRNTMTDFNSDSKEAESVIVSPLPKHLYEELHASLKGQVFMRGNPQ